MTNSTNSTRDELLKMASATIEILTEERSRFSDALTWLEHTLPNGIAMVARALTAADEGHVEGRRHNALDLSSLRADALEAQAIREVLQGAEEDYGDGSVTSADVVMRLIRERNNAIAELNDFTSKQIDIITEQREFARKEALMGAAKECDKEEESAMHRGERHEAKVARWCKKHILALASAPTPEEKKP